MTIDLHHFPFPESHYATNGIQMDRFAGLSLVAFHVDMVRNHEANILKKDQKRGVYMFRNQGVPLPRPATQLAWERICRLGKLTSDSFLVPFLPALRDEDEVGQAIAERGIHVGSLSRRSSAHIREPIVTPHGSYDCIIWGEVYLAEAVEKNIGVMHSAIVSKNQRSNFVEALIVPYRNNDSAVNQESIRTRMEFLAQYGLISTHHMAKSASIPRINRLMFQFLNQEHASFWADAYRDTFFQIRKDPGIIQTDYQAMIADMRVKFEESLIEETKKVEKNSTGRMEFGGISL